jgi:hypothetical protein
VFRGKFEWFHGVLSLITELARCPENGVGGSDKRGFERVVGKRYLTGLRKGCPLIRHKSPLPSIIN